MAVTNWLIDKSALVRLRDCSDAEEWVQRIQRGLVHVSSLTKLEVGYSARSGSDYARLLDEPPVASMITQYSTPAIEDRALQVQRLLARRGHHRGPSIPDLLIAATAELNDLTLLHVDADFERIAKVTAQAVERLRV